VINEHGNGVGINLVQSVAADALGTLFNPTVKIRKNPS